MLSEAAFAIELVDALAVVLDDNALPLPEEAAVNLP